MKRMRILFACAFVASLLCTHTGALSDNLPPIVTAKQAQTLQNIPIWGSVGVYDPEGDAVTLEVVREAEKGMVSVYEKTFVYRPFAEEDGQDSFVVTARDSAGNLAREATVTVMIGQNKMGQGFSDMRLNPSHGSALMLAQAGVVSGEQVGEALLFRPQAPVTRSEFLLMLLAAVDTKEELAPCVNTGLPNDGELALWLKPYLRQAKRLGLAGPEAFMPEETLTRAQAVELVNRASGMPNVEAQMLHVSDLEEIPTACLQSYINLAAHDMLGLYDTRARPQDTLTRAVAADLVWQLYRVAAQSAPAP